MTHSNRQPSLVHAFTKATSGAILLLRCVVPSFALTAQQVSSLPAVLPAGTPAQVRSPNDSLTLNAVFFDVTPTDVRWHFTMSGAPDLSKVQAVVNTVQADRLATAHLTPQVVLDASDGRSIVVSVHLNDVPQFADASITWGPSVSQRSLLFRAGPSFAAPSKPYGDLQRALDTLNRLISQNLVGLSRFVGVSQVATAVMPEHIYLQYDISVPDLTTVEICRVDSNEHPVSACAEYPDHSYNTAGHHFDTKVDPNAQYRIRIFPGIDTSNAESVATGYRSDNHPSIYNQRLAITTPPLAAPPVITPSITANKQVLTLSSTSPVVAHACATSMVNIAGVMTVPANPSVTCFGPTLRVSEVGQLPADLKVVTEFPIGTLPVGTYSLSAEALDASGNVVPISSPVIYSREAPVQPSPPLTFTGALNVVIDPTSGLQLSWHATGKPASTSVLIRMEQHGQTTTIASAAAAPAAANGEYTGKLNLAIIANGLQATMSDTSVHTSFVAQMSDTSGKVSELAASIRLNLTAAKASPNSVPAAIKSSISDVVAAYNGSAVPSGKSKLASVLTSLLGIVSFVL